MKLGKTPPLRLVIENRREKKWEIRTDMFRARRAATKKI